MSELFIQIILFLATFSVTLVWILTIPFNFSTWLRNIFSKNGLVIVPLELVIFFQLINILKFPLPPSQLDKVLIIAGLLFCLSGAGLAIWAKIVMKNNWGIPAKHDVKRQKQLVTSGPFSLSRNPIYLGLFFLVIGIELAVRSYLVILIAPIFFLIYKAILAEEKLLEKYFGNKYLEYKSKVPRFIFFI